MKLNDLNKYDKAKIVKVSSQRLRDIGIREGKILEVLSKSKTISLIKIDFCIFGINENIEVERI